ncbi:MAG TPA: hypothetical protein VNB64_06065 [Solirubrobacteraceae bacterium]|nr:hypothetical protein [Solirubrobacteraceae bacterium]
MGVVHGLDADWVENDNDPLVARLRGLKWAEVPTDVRARCWERINNRMAVVDDGAPAAAAHDSRERYDFTRRRLPGRVAVAQAWSRRPATAAGLAPARPLLPA